MQIHSAAFAPKDGCSDTRTQKRPPREDNLTSNETLRLTQFAIDRCSDAAYWMEPDGRIIYVNKEACRILGYPREELLDMTVFDIDPNFEQDAWVDHWQVIKQAKSLRLESVHRAKCGRIIPVDISANYVQFDNKAYNCAFARDLTEKREAGQKAKEYEFRLNMAQRMEALGMLAGGIAHDFNNILSSILGFSELALESIESDTLLHDNVREIFTAGMRARDLVRQILTFSRQTEQERQPVQMKLIVKETLKLLRASMPATIAIRSDTRFDGLVMADPGQLHQIVMNLCANAGYAMQPGGGTLTVGLKQVDLGPEYTDTHPQIDSGSYVQFTVTDTGRGIAPESLNRVFDPFFTTKKQGEGTGMGLSMVHGIITEYGGSIDVRSDPDKGSTLTAYLPLMQRTQRGVAADARALPTGMEHILFVDDEPAITKMASQMLRRLNYRVTHLTSSIEALALFREQASQFDLVITDFTMPHLTGPKLAAEIMAVRPEIPIVLCTGYSGEISEPKAEEMGIKAFILKPISKSILANTVRKVLDESNRLKSEER